MTLKLFILGYITIGLIFQTICMLKDLILRKLGCTEFSVDQMQLKWHVLIRIIEVFIWPIEVVFTIYVIINGTPKLTQVGFDYLEEFDRQEREKGSE